MIDATRALQGVTASARRGDEQNRWLMVAAIGGIIIDNREAVEACRKAAARTKKAVRCAIEIGDGE